MGTRAIIIVEDEEDNKIIEMYKQFDGYPDGLGNELINYIDSKSMVNGIGSDKNVFNGINCFAASLVEHFKDGPGGIYLHTPSNNSFDAKDYYDKYGAEYVYEISSNLNIKCWDAWNNKEIPLIDGRFPEE